MKRIRGKREFVAGLIAAAIGVVCLVVCIVQGCEIRFLIAALLSLVYAIMSFYNAFSKKGILEEIEKELDERDIYLTMKASKMTIKILNYILFAVCLTSLILYAAFDHVLFMVIAVVLCIILIITFAIMLFVNHYYEKRG